MFESIKDQIEVRKLENKLDNIKYFYLRQINETKMSGQDIQKIYAEMDAETLSHRVDLNLLRTRILKRKANKLNIPIPKHNNKEYWDNFSKLYYWLNENGRHFVTKLIRKEHKERLDYWLPYLIALLGLLVALISELKG